MPFRAFGVRTQSGTAQPLLGTTLTAAVTPTPQIQGQYSGVPASGPSQTVLPVTDASWFQVGDRVAMGTLAAFADPRTSPNPGPDYGNVTAVNLAGKTITVQGLLRAHASGEFVVLCLPFANLNLQVLTSAVTYVGTDSGVGAASTTLMLEIGTSGNYSLGASTNINAYNTNQLWTLGAAADTYLPMLTLI